MAAREIPAQYRWHVAKDPFTVILAVAAQESKAPEVARVIGELLTKFDPHIGFDLDDFLAELAEATNIIVQFRPMVPEWRATYDR